MLTDVMAIYYEYVHTVMQRKVKVCVAVLFPSVLLNDREKATTYVVLLFPRCFVNTCVYGVRGVVVVVGVWVIRLEFVWGTANNPNIIK